MKPLNYKTLLFFLALFWGGLTAKPIPPQKAIPPRSFKTSSLRRAHAQLKVGYKDDLGAVTVVADKDFKVSVPCYHWNIVGLKSFTLINESEFTGYSDCVNWTDSISNVSLQIRKYNLKDYLNAWTAFHLIGTDYPSFPPIHAIVNDTLTKIKSFKALKNLINQDNHSSYVEFSYGNDQNSVIYYIPDGTYRLKVTFTLEPCGYKIPTEKKLKCASKYFEKTYRGVLKKALTLTIEKGSFHIQ